MTDEQIIKGFERCFTLGFDKSTYYECPFYTATAKCTEDLRDSVLALINRQKTEIESLKQIIDENDKEILKLQKRIIFWREDLNYQPEKIKSEAIKEFAERLKSKLQWDCEFSNKLVFENDIDNLVKEMTEGE